MSTAIEMIMDSDALEETGPWTPRAGTVANVLPSGVRPTRVVPFAFDTAPGSSPVGSGALTYIDETVGGVQDMRGDIVVDYGSGFRSYRSRTQRFLGDTLRAAVPFETVDAGYVGLHGEAGGRQRAAMGNKTRLPDEADVRAAFTNPGLARLLASLRGGNQ